MRYPWILVSALAVSGAACGTSEPTPRDVPIWSVTLTDGVYTFVHEHADGTFKTTVRVPYHIVPRSPADGPFTVSLCDPTWNITIENVRATHSDPSEWDSADVDGHCIFADSVLTSTFAAGDPGVFGYVQTGYDEDGHLAVGFGLHYKWDGSGSGGGNCSEFMYATGYSVDDPTPDDPILAGACGCSLEGICAEP